MSDERHYGVVDFLSNRYYDHAPAFRSLKRKLGQSVPTTSAAYSAYPSPPMSHPPSPTRPPFEPTSSATTEGQPITSTTTTLATTTAPFYASGPFFFQPPTPTPFPGYAPARLSPPALAPPNTSQAPTDVFNVLPSGQSVFSVGPSTAAGPSYEATAATRAGRKAKTHVASACMNCKRAHLSCDVQRPCTRCVASGKQDTCFDVPHKKRGRPRLREEGEFEMEQMVTQPIVPTPAPMTAAPTPARPMARTRHQRTESLRSLRSQTSEGSSASSLPTPSFPPILQPAWTYQGPRPPSSSMSAALVPTAYLDLDLNFIRANRPFQQILANDEDVRGRTLQDLVAPADDESLSTIRGRLKAERENRDPTFMPPIMSAGEDPVYGVREDDIERLAQGFSDHTYTWTRNTTGPRGETFPARVRLAKAAAYFVAVTLPSFRPVDMLPPQPVSAGPSPGFMVPPSRPQSFENPPFQSRFESQATRPMSYPSYPGPAPRQQPIPGPARQSRTYPTAQPYQPMQNYPPLQPPPQPATPRRAMPNPAMPAAQLTPQTAAGRPQSQFMESVQLPPLVPGPSTQTVPQPPRPFGAAEAAQPSSDDDGEDSPKKRRRMDISDVLR